MHRNRLFWGGILVLLGTALLLQSIGVVNFNIWVYVWPAVIILFGSWILYQSLRKTDEITESFSLPFEPVDEALVEIRHGAGRLELTAAEDEENLVSGTFGGGVVHEYNRDGDKAKLMLRPPTESLNWFSFGPRTQGYQWKAGFRRGVRYQYELKTGAGENFFNFRDLSVSKIRLDTGASDTRMILPANAVFTRLDVHAGAASFEATVPQGVAARIEIQSGLSSMNVDQQRFPQRGNGRFESENFETAENRVEIRIEGGMGSFSIK